MSIFLKGGELFVREYSAEEKTELWNDETIIHYARSCIGDDGYNVVFNNCEHFCNQCTLGEHKSKQVEDVLNPFNRGGSKMLGLLTKLFTKDKTMTTYEPDKVRVAEIENQTKMMLKKLEAENIVLNAKMQKELVSHMIEQEAVLIQAKIEGYSTLLKEIGNFNNSLIELRIEKSIELEQNQNENEKDILSYYENFENKLNENNNDFELNHLPKLNVMRDGYEKGSASYEIYSQMIIERVKLHIQKMTEDAHFFREQRVKRLETSRDIHKALQANLNEMNKKMLEIASKKSDLLEISENEKILLEQSQSKMLENKKETLQFDNPSKQQNAIEFTGAEIIDAK